MKTKYGANERAQMLKYHIQTSGRSLHAQEIDFNDIRTTLQALHIAIYPVTPHCKMRMMKQSQHLPRNRYVVQWQFS
jgi:methylmalonyl-CoA mutase N-terminal domain/subunit